MPDPVQEVYVGPRPFERSERGLFFGRDREISELLSLVTSSRVVLCYAPSGAGKTSLINAGLLPRLEKEGFEVLPSTRVRGLIPEGIDQEKVTNLYVFNALLSLAGEGGAAAELTGRTLAEFLSALPHLTDEEDFQAPRILIFDQFEELLTSYPERWQERDGFFHQVRAALQADPLLRVVFVMREDFLARIEPFTRLLKPFPQARFRLDLLGKEGARAAVTGPLQGTGRHFKEGVAAALIEELLKVRVETTQGEAVEVVGEYVEPVQLQVVCRNLWMSLPPEVQEISSEHLEAYGDVDQALRDFYESCLAEAKAGLRANERSLRQWFEQQLITPAGTRGIVFRDAKRTAELPNTVVDFLENRHLIRGEWRAGSRWYELTHDRFIEPIQRANEHWRARRQASRNRWIMAGAGLLMLVLASIAVVINTQTASQPVSAPTIAAAQTSAQTTASVAEATSQVAQEDLALSRSRQLAAEALLVSDPDLALLLAVEANRSFDTPEAHRSLHRILSRQAVIDGEFLRELDPEILSPTLVKRLDDHKNPVLSVAFSRDGRRFVSAGSADFEAATLILWDIDVARVEPVIPPMTGHRSNILSVAFSPDGKKIASGSLDQQILLWDASTGTSDLSDPLLKNIGLVTSVAFSPDGKRLASGGGDGTVRIWDLTTGESLAEVSHRDPVWGVAWSTDGTLLASAGADSVVRVWETEKFNEFRTLEGHNGLVRTVAWSRDGRTLASASVPAEGNEGRAQVFLWDVPSGEIISRPLSENILPVRTVAFDPSGRILAMGRDDGTIVLWDTVIQQTLGEPLEAHNHRVMSIAFSPDGQYMASGSLDKTVALWDLFAPTRSVAISPEGRFLAASHGAAISLWDLSTDMTTPLRVLSGHTEDVLALAFTPECVNPPQASAERCGSTLISGGRDDTIRLWDVRTGEQFLGPLIAAPQTGPLGDVLTLAISPADLTFVSGSENGEVLLWEWDRDPEYFSVQTFHEHNEAVIKVQIDEAGETLLWAGADGSLQRSDESQRPIPGVQGSGSITSLAVSPNWEGVAFSTETVTTILEDNRRAYGIEISEFDNSFDPKLNQNDIDFIVVKATDGLQVDPRFKEFLGPIQAVSIRGAMHLFQPDQPWQEQADLFLSVVKDQGFHFYTLDLRVSPQDGSTTFLSDAEQWLKHVDERVEQKVLLQTSSIFFTFAGSSGDWMKEWPLLINNADESDRNGNPFLPQGVDDWKIWQYSAGQEMGAQFGVGKNNVPLDVYNGTPLDMWEWLELPTFAIYDRVSDKLIQPGQAIRVTGLNGIAYSPDGAYIAVAGEGMVSLLKAESGEEITTLSFGGIALISLSFMPDASTLAIGTEDGTVRLWDLSLLDKDTEAERTLEIACSQAQRNFTRSEWLQYFGTDLYRSTCPNLPLGRD